MMNFIGVNPLSNNNKTSNDDNPATWISFGAGYAYIGTADRNLITDFPTTVACFLQNFIYNNYIYQILYPLTSAGTIFHRGGRINADDTSTWYSSWATEATREWVTNEVLALGSADTITTTWVTDQIQAAIDSTWEASY